MFFFFGVVFWVALFERERERYIYTTTKIHSLNDGKGAKMKKRLFLLPSRPKEGKRVIIKSHKRRTFSLLHFTTHLFFFFPPLFFSFLWVLY